VCFGRIGNGDTFCVAEASACTIQSHRKTKIEWEPDVSQFFIQKTDMSVFCSPAISKSHVSSDLEDWLVNTSLPRRDDSSP